MDNFFKENLIQEKYKMEYISGHVEINTMDNIKIIKNMEKVNSFGLMEQFMKEYGKKEKEMGKDVCIY